MLIIGLGVSLLVIIIAAFVPADEQSIMVPAIDRSFDEQWCESMMELPSAQWQEDATLAFAKHCLTD